MGLFGNWWHGRRMRDPVKGIAQVVSVTAADTSASSGSYRITCVVTAPGVPATEIVHVGSSTTGKWPSPGDHLAVMVDRADPRRLRIQWNDVPGATAPIPSTRGSVHVHTNIKTTLKINGRPVDASRFPGLKEALASAITQNTGDPAAMKQALEKLIGEEGTLAQAIESASPEEAIADKLRKLQSLKESGLLSEVEYADRRKQILDSI
jgi:hypothetical protein